MQQHSWIGIGYAVDVIFIHNVATAAFTLLKNNGRNPAQTEVRECKQELAKRDVQIVVTPWFDFFPCVRKIWNTVFTIFVLYGEIVFPHIKRSCKASEKHWAVQNKKVFKGTRTGHKKITAFEDDEEEENECDLEG